MKCQHCGAPTATAHKDLFIKLLVYFTEMKEACINNDDDEIGEDAKDAQDWLWDDNVDGKLLEEIKQALKQ